MKIAIIGDPHGSSNIKKIPLKNIDLILLVGDIGKADLARKLAFAKVENPKFKPLKIEQKKAHMEIYNSSIKILKYLSKFAPVFLIYGNVEYDPEKFSHKFKNKSFPSLEKRFSKIKNVTIINNKKIIYKGIKIGGLQYFIDTCWIKEFNSKDKAKISDSKNGSRKAIKILNKFRGIDILLCHQPPYGILDKVGSMAPKAWRGKHAGSKIILNYVKKNQPKYVFCGHIHEKKGLKKMRDTKMYNVGCCGDYLILNIDTTK